MYELKDKKKEGTRKPIWKKAAATGVAGMAADIGDIITIGMVVLAGAGAEVEDLIMPDVV